MKSIEIELKSGRSKGRGIIQLGGYLTLDNVEALAGQFREAVSRFQGLRIRLQDVEEVDLGFLQLLETLRVYQSGRGELLELEASLPEGARTLLRNTGFGHLIESRVVTLSEAASK